MVTKYLRPSISEMKFHLGPQTQEVIPHGHKALLFLGQFVKNKLEPLLEGEKEKMIERNQEKMPFKAPLP